MKKLLLFVLVVFCDFSLCAQNGNEQRYLLTTKTNTYGLSLLSLSDPYLSPLKYTGNGIQFEHESRRFWSETNTRWSFQGKLDAEVGMLLNPAQNSTMTYMAVNYSKGLHYLFKPANGWSFMAGGNWDIGLGYKDVARNINNPGNVDLATNFNLSGIAICDLQLKRRTLRLQLSVETPLIGWMYVPLAGASYYEMFRLGNLSGISHFSSVFNRRGINPRFTVDVPLKRSVWRVGVGYQKLQYTANKLVFDRNEMSLILGTTFDAIHFGGSMRKAPKNFISPND